MKCQFLVCELLILHFNRDITLNKTIHFWIWCHKYELITYDDTNIIDDMSVTELNTLWYTSHIFKEGLVRNWNFDHLIAFKDQILLKTLAMSYSVKTHADKSFNLFKFATVL